MTVIRLIISLPTKDQQTSLSGIHVVNETLGYNGTRQIYMYNVDEHRERRLTQVKEIILYVIDPTNNLVRFGICCPFILISGYWEIFF